MPYKNHEQKLLCQKRYRENHKEKLKQYYLTDGFRERARNYYYKNWEENRRKRNEYYNKNKEKILERERIRRRKLGIMPIGKSGSEEKVYRELIKVFLPKEIKRNDRRIVKNPETGRWLELDFYIPSQKLAIEVDGIFHRLNRYGEKRLNIQLRNDYIKERECQKLGINLVKIPFGKDIKMFGEKVLLKLDYLERLCQ
jgi:hypothetical protein